MFEDKILSMESIKAAVDQNFKDHDAEEVRQILLNHVPKYGNDDPYVDNMAKDCLNTIVKELRKHSTIPGQGYGATISPVAAHMGYGMICGATPDIDTLEMTLPR